ncbi:MAG: F0F1 ATP synthase subunit epsilon, partial [Candidatus Neomarinimicrobiota bacterium]
ATGGGYADVKGDRVLLLVESAEFKDEIDVERARQAAERARNRLRDETADHSRAKAALARATNRLKLVQS